MILYSDKIDAWVLTLYILNGIMINRNFNGGYKDEAH